MNIDFIRSLRSYAKLTQTQMAKILNISTTSYNKKENGKVPFALEEIKTLSEYFNVPIENFFKEKVFKTNTN